MAWQHLVRVGAMGVIGRFTSVDGTRFPRHARVILRTGRGLEVGEVLTPPDDSLATAPSDGSILRGMTVEDTLLAARLDKNRQQACDACAGLLNERGIQAVLMDAEQLFDGNTLAFYFLGEVTHELESLTEELAAQYDARVEFSKFADTLEHGCGPGCGTEDAAGQGCTSCGSGCAIAGACGTAKKLPRAHSHA